MPDENTQKSILLGIRLSIVPVELRDANAFVTKHHRHHKAVQGHRFSIGVEDPQNVLHGVATVGRPVARMLTGKRVEATRVCTDGTPNACSALYGAVCRIKHEMGYEVAQTYILASENGASLRAAGWKPVATSGGGSWSRVDRERTDKAPLEAKIRWECRHSALPAIELQVAA